MSEANGDPVVLSRDTAVKLGTVISIVASLVTLLSGGAFMYANLTAQVAENITRKEYYEQNQKLVTKEDLRLLTVELGRRIENVEKKVDRITSSQDER